MPTYEYRCQNEECQHYFEKILSISQYREKGDHQACPECESEDVQRLITTCNFKLKGDDWPGKAMRINSQMRERQRKLAPRQEARRREEPVAGLVPNVAGERTESWKEAQRLARDKGKDSLTYTEMVRKEEAAKK